MMDNEKNDKFDLTIVIVNYNAKNFLMDCIKSVYSSENRIKFEIVVVDNDSQDGSKELITTNYPSIVWIQNSVNEGFAKANNQGFKIAKGKYIMLLNNDTIVFDYSLDRLVEFLNESKEVGAVGPRILNTDRTLQLSCRRGLPNAVNSLGYFTKLYKIFPNNKALGSYTMSYLRDNESHAVEALSGAAMVIRKEIVEKIGGLDENFFMHFEDIDLCLRIGKAGYKLFYVYNSEIVHIKGQSSKLRSKKVIMDFHNSLYYYYKKNYSKEKSFFTNSFVYLLIGIKKNLSLLIYNLKNVIRN